VGGDVRTLRLLLQQLTERVVSGELETARGAVGNQLIGTQIKLLEYERKVKEQDDFEGRLEQLEQAGGKENRWATSKGV
jgi:hypothetical protein